MIQAPHDAYTLGGGGGGGGETNAAFKRFLLLYLVYTYDSKTVFKKYKM